MSSDADRAMKLGLASIRSTVKQKFDAAQGSGALVFSDTQVTLLRTRHGFPLQLRYCPALAKKPIDNKAPTSKDQPKFDPFEDPTDDLLIARVPTANPKYNLVLNKYPVIPNHFILATKANLPQTDLLDPDDLAATYACLRAWRDDHVSIQTEQNDVFAFFNSGPQSGASQPHRHIQFLPVGDMKHGLTDAEDIRAWQPLLKDVRKAHPISASLPQMVKYDPNLTFLLLTTPLNDGISSASKLYDRYLLLLRAARLLSENPEARLDGVDLSSIPITDSPESKHVSFSYNLALNLKHMAICPRRSEGTRIPGLDGNEVAMNGTILAGTMMVKLPEEWEALKQLDRSEKLDEMLARIGFPAVAVTTDGNGGEADVSGKL